METKYIKTFGSGAITRRRRGLGEWRLDRAHGVSPLKVRAALGVVEAPLREDEKLATERPGWIVTVFDNDHNTYEDVMGILMLATGCTAEEAYMEAWEIDHLGKSVVHQACEKDCRDAAGMIAKIGIKVVVSEE